MRVEWSDHAQRELRGIYDYIAQNSERYALQVVQHITSKTQQLAQFPESGAHVVEFTDQNLRELLVYSYRIIYHFQPNRITILSIVHGARPLHTR